MATNPEAGLFPGIAQPPFVTAPEVGSLAVKVMRRWDEFGELRRAVTDGALEIQYVFETKPFDQTKEEFKPHTIAKVTKASPLWLSLTGHDLVIQFRKTFWDLFDARQREAVLHHELMHIDWTDGKLSLRAHDVEEMSKTARRYGAALPGRKVLLDAFLAYQREQGGADVVPLRVLDDAIEASIDAAADPNHPAREIIQPLVDIAETNGTDITITHGDRSATIRGRKDGKA